MAHKNTSQPPYKCGDLVKSLNVWDFNQPVVVAHYNDEANFYYCVTNKGERYIHRARELGNAVDWTIPLLDEYIAIVAASIAKLTQPRDAEAYAMLDELFLTLRNIRNEIDE